MKKYLLLSCAMIVVLLSGCASVPKKTDKGNELVLEEHFPGSRIYHLAEDRRGNIWAYTDALYRYDGSNWERITVMPNTKPKDITCMLVDRSNNLWFGTGSHWDWSGNGIMKYDGSEWKQYTTADGLTQDVVLTLTQDRSGTMWAGVLDGVCRLEGERWVMVHQAKRRFIPRRIYEDSTGRIWLTDYTGFYELTDGEAVQVLDGQWITFTEGTDGTLYVGGAGGRVGISDGETFTTTNIAGGVRVQAIDKNPTLLSTESDGTIWASVVRPVTALILPAGLYRYDGSAWITESRSGQFYQTHVDGSGNLWMATGYSVMYHMDSQWTEVTNVPMDVTQWLNCRSGDLWLGTWKGLYRVVALP